MICHLNPAQSFAAVVRSCHAEGTQGHEGEVVGKVCEELIPYY